MWQNIDCTKIIWFGCFARGMMIWCNFNNIYVQPIASILHRQDEKYSFCETMLLPTKLYFFTSHKTRFTVTCDRTWNFTLFLCVKRWGKPLHKLQFIACTFINDDCRWVIFISNWHKTLYASNFVFNFFYQHVFLFLLNTGTSPSVTFRITHRDWFVASPSVGIYDVGDHSTDSRRYASIVVADSWAADWLVFCYYSPRRMVSVHLWNICIWTKLFIWWKSAKSASWRTYRRKICEKRFAFTVPCKGTVYRIVETFRKTGVMRNKNKIRNPVLYSEMQFTLRKEVKYYIYIIYIGAPKIPVEYTTYI